MDHTSLIPSQFQYFILLFYFLWSIKVCLIAKDEASEDQKLNKWKYSYIGISILNHSDPLLVKEAVYVMVTLNYAILYILVIYISYLCHAQQVYGYLYHLSNYQSPHLEQILTSK